jgi:hypothetical protein
MAINVLDGSEVSTHTGSINQTLDGVSSALQGTSDAPANPVFSGTLNRALNSVQSDLFASHPGGAVAPPDFIIPTSTGTWNGASEGVFPGAIVQIAAGNRGTLRINDVVSSDLSNPIIIRSDPAGVSTIRRTNAQNGDFIFRINDSRGWILDGSYTSGQTYGIKVMHSINGVDSPSAFIQMWGVCQDYIIRNIEVDGGYLQPNETGGIGIQHNDNSVTSPGVQLWRENIIVERCKVYDVDGEGIYLGPNYGGGLSNVTPLRNIEVRYNDLQRCGRDACQIKSTIDGNNSFHHNYCKTTGLRLDEHQGAQKLGFGYFEGSGDVYNNWFEDSGEHGILNFCLARPNSYSLPPTRIYNNIIIRSGVNDDAIAQDGDGIRVDAGSGMAIPEYVEIYNNTIIDSENVGIRVYSEISTPITVQNNISVGNGGSDIALPGHAVESNNQTGTVASQFFDDAGLDNYSLTTNSPALDNATTGLTASTDYADVSRPQGPNKDQGALELLQVTPRNLRAEIAFASTTLDTTPQQDGDGVYRDFGYYFGYTKFGNPITINDIENTNPAIAHYTGDQPPSNSGYTLDTITSGMTEMSNRLVRPKNITGSTFTMWQDGDDTGYNSPFPGNTNFAGNSINATGYGNFTGSVSAQNYRRDNGATSPHPYDQGADRYPGLGIVTTSTVPPTNNVGSATAVTPLEGSNFLGHQINFWVDHWTKEDGTQHSAGNNTRCQLFWDSSSTAMTNQEVMWFGFSIHLPSNFHQDVDTNNRNFSKTQLMEIEDNPGVPQANLFELSVSHVDSDGPDMVWSALMTLNGTNSSYAPETDFGPITDDIGKWTSFICKIRSHPTNGTYEVWKSTGPYTSGQRRAMTKVFSRLGQPVGYTPSDGNFQPGLKQYKFAWHQRPNTIDSIVQWIGFDSIRWGTEESDGTSFEDVHPFQETEAQATS